MTKLNNLQKQIEFYPICKVLENVNECYKIAVKAESHFKTAIIEIIFAVVFGLHKVLRSFGNSVPYLMK